MPYVETRSYGQRYYRTLRDLNQDVGYRQGMHELLAPILWVVEEDALRSEEPISTDTDEFMMDVLNASFIEHDAFSLFSLIMQSAKAFYETGEIDAKTNDQGNQREDQHGSSPIVERSKRIHEVYLARVDPELASHLTELEVLPQIFLM
ncbi:MAG: hypothetical protein M1818_004606 [Claussenomyces sp. TS43310]|nr:MAG: hypothetical protein M1818_004606 [Claussenomyces sp. TS43310]